MSDVIPFPTIDSDVQAFARACAAWDACDYEKAQQLFVLACLERFPHFLEPAVIDEATEELTTPEDRARILARAL